MVRHKLRVMAVVGNDACWNQIYRDQVEFLKDDVACTLRYTEYNKVSEGWGATGVLIGSQEEVQKSLQQALEYHKKGSPCVINVLLKKSDFRKGSISV